MPSSPEYNKSIIKQAFKHVIEASNVSEAEISCFFSPDYVQHVDGNILNYNDFVQHIHAQRNTVASMRVTFSSIVAEGDTVFTNHTALARKEDGNEIKVKVLAQFTVRGEKIAACDELTYMLSGGADDQDLGSRH